MLHVVIINGSGGCGKDTFVSLCVQLADALPEGKLEIFNYSSVTCVKKIARSLGWTGSKTEEDRLMLSDLKDFLTRYFNLPLLSMISQYKHILNDNSYNFDELEGILFLHIREPEEIAKAKKEFKATTLLIKRQDVSQITSNHADKNVYDYDYDVIIENNGTLDDFYHKATLFVDELI